MLDTGVVQFHRITRSPIGSPFSLVRGVRADRRIVLVVLRTADATGAGSGTDAIATVVTEVLLAESSKALLLCDGVDVGTNDKRDNVEEWYPELVREELLRKGEADGGSDPGHAHHLPETDLDGGANLVVGACASNESHCHQVDGVLDGRDLKEFCS